MAIDIDRCVLIDKRKLVRAETDHISVHSMYLFGTIDEIAPADAEDVRNA